MIVALTLAVAFALGVDLRRLALLAGAIYLPLIVAGLIALYWFRARPDSSNSPALFCEAVASELRAGANLRDALTTAATSVGDDANSVDLPPGSSMTEVAARVAAAFPAIEEELRLVVLTASRSGSDAAALFDEIASLSIAKTEVSREVRVATAPGRATALVLIGAPVFYVVGRASSGGLGSLVVSSEQRVAAVVGLGLFAAGLAWASLVLWRASR
ncbi:MAG: hypothetical protein ACLFWH_04985 [Actinomycetota bacterium]